MQPYKVCPHCQTPADLSAAVCTSCGREFNTQPPPPGQTSFMPGGPGGAPQYQPSYAPVDSSKKIAAGILGIVLGGFGVHKFILGYTQAGIIMLLVSLLSCGIAYPVMHIIGLVEGIIYLSKSDYEFQQTYLVGKKEWF